MLLGTIVGVGHRAVPAAAATACIAEGFTGNDVLLWVMWPATGMLVAGGLTALALRWRMLTQTFQTCSTPVDRTTASCRCWVVHRRRDLRGRARASSSR